MTSLVERLRDPAVVCLDVTEGGKLLIEAADEIERGDERYCEMLERNDAQQKRIAELGDEVKQAREGALSDAGLLDRRLTGLADQDRCIAELEADLDASQAGMRKLEAELAAARAKIELLQTDLGFCNSFHKVAVADYELAEHKLDKARERIAALDKSIDFAIDIVQKTGYQQEWNDFNDALAAIPEPEE